MTFNCGFCINLGLKTTNHHVSTCPELAKTECRYCHELGHTVSKCHKLGNGESKRKSTTDSRRKIVKGADGWTSIPKTNSDNKKAFIRDNSITEEKPSVLTMADMLSSKLTISNEGTAYKGTFQNLKEVDLSESVEQGLKVTKPVAPKGAWAAGRPKPIEVRPHQELRPESQPQAVPKPQAAPKPQAVPKPKAVPKPQVFMSTNQNTGGNYDAEEELRQKAAKQGLTLWGDDDDQEMDLNDPFFA